MINVETKSIQIIDTNSKACSKVNYDIVHSSDQDRSLSSVDIRLYQIALVEAGGVNPQDAREKVKEIKKLYQNGGSNERRRLGDVLGHAFEGLTASRKSLQLEPVQEIIVFKNS